MREDFSRLAGLVKVAGTINGRKKLQKIVFILQTMGVPFGERFTFHYFGPYSATLQLEMDALVSGGVVKEDKDDLMYRYSVAHGKDLPENEEIDKAAHDVEYLNGLSVQTLELAATMLYLRRKGYGPDDVVRKKALFLKPELRPKLIEAEDVYKKVLPKLSATG